MNQKKVFILIPMITTGWKILKITSHSPGWVIWVEKLIPMMGYHRKNKKICCDRTNFPRIFTGKFPNPAVCSPAISFIRAITLPARALAGARPADFNQCEITVFPWTFGISKNPESLESSWNILFSLKLKLSMLILRRKFASKQWNFRICRTFYFQL